jgi:diguanylate cyclase (GGDEF)-like protein
MLRNNVVINEQRKTTLSSIPLWQSRGHMVSHALAKSLSWFAFVNGSFALMIYLRNIMFGNFDAGVVVSGKLLTVIDLLMLATLLVSVAMLAISFVLKAKPSPAIKPLLSLLLLLQSGLWAASGFSFITALQTPLAYPLSSILMMSALAALYYWPSGLLLFVVPIWLATVAGNLQVNAGLNLRFSAVCLIFTLILIYGRYMLQGWFNEAWLRFQENQLLISRLDTLAHQDVLTGTANRRALEDHLHNAVSRQASFELILLDVDYFKRYNDHYGHQAGDVCLAEVAAVLKTAVRTSGDLVARYGGEEFVVMLFGATPQGAEQIAERIQANLQQAHLRHERSDVSDTVTVSMGIASSDGSKGVAQILAEADAALYRAKEQGRNRWCR